MFESIEKNKKENKWAFLFIGANIDTMRTGGAMGVSAGNTMSYTNTDRGVHTAYMNMSGSVKMMRSMSVSKTSSVDLDNLLADNGVDKEDIKK